MFNMEKAKEARVNKNVYNGVKINTNKKNSLKLQFGAPVVNLCTK